MGRPLYQLSHWAPFVLSFSGSFTHSYNKSPSHPYPNSIPDTTAFSLDWWLHDTYKDKEKYCFFCVMSLTDVSNNNSLTLLSSFQLLKTHNLWGISLIHLEECLLFTNKCADIYNKSQQAVVWSQKKWRGKWWYSRVKKSEKRNHESPAG